MADDLGWVVRKGDKIIRGEDGGKTWGQQLTTLTANCQSIVAWQA